MPPLSSGISLFEPNGGKHFLHGALDPWFLGGLSLLLGFLWWFYPSVGDESQPVTPFFLTASSQRWSQLAQQLSLWVNWPHFIVSYWILYVGFVFRGFWKKLRFWWAGVVVPLVLLVALGWIVKQAHVMAASLFIHLMFLTVGWHYVKQVYGIVVVDSFKKGYPLDQRMRYGLLSHFYATWGFHYFWAHHHSHEFQFYGVTYHNPGFPKVIVWVAGALWVLTGIALLRQILKQRILFKQWPTFNSIVAWIALNVWFFVADRIPEFLVMVPFFHSLQYLWMVWAHHWKTAHEGLSGRIVEVIERFWLFLLGLGRHCRSSNQATGMTPVFPHSRWNQDAKKVLNFQEDPLFLKSFSRWHVVILIFGICVGVGYWVFWGIPVRWSLAPEWNLQRQVWGDWFWVAFFQAFINIHHYFIDNVIWRKDTPGLIL